jgi:hypothetical protein
MKLLATLTLISAMACSHGALRGHDDVDGERKLASYVYQEHQGACRKKSNGTGGGSSKNDYDIYKKEDDPNLSYSSCKKMCDKNRDCTGIEWRDTGSTSQCEVWTSEIKVSAGTMDCIVRVGVLVHVHIAAHVHKHCAHSSTTSY